MANQYVLIINICILLIGTLSNCQYHYTYVDPILQLSNLPISPNFPNGISNIQYFQASFGPNFINNTDSYKFKGRVVIANGALEGCNKYPNSTRDNKPWNGTIVFVYRNVCGYFLKAAPAQNAGAAAVFVVNCSPGPPTYCSTGRTLMNAVITTYPESSNQPPLIPMGLISYDDGSPIINLLQMDPSLNITLTLSGTDKLIDPTGEIRKGLASIATSIPTRGTGTTADKMNGAMLSQDWAQLDLSLAQNDICTMKNKPYQFMCREGKVTRYENGARPSPGFITPDINKLVDLEMFCLDKGGASGTVPDLKNLTNLKSLVLSSNTGINNLPSSIGVLQNLKVFAVNSCSLTALPQDISMLPNIEVFWIQSNKLTILPAVDVKQMRWIDVSNNNIASPLLNFSNSPFLFTINFSSNKVLSQNASMLFQNLPMLSTISLAKNLLYGPLPLFEGCPRLQVINVNDNQFTGAIPTSWNIPKHCTNNISLSCSQDFDCGKDQFCQSVLQVSAARNKITGPFNFSATTVTDLDLSSNLMDYNTPVWLSKDRGGYLDLSITNLINFIKSLIPATMVNLNLAANKLSGPWDTAGYSNYLNSLQILNISQNGLTGLPSDMWGVDNLAGVFRVFDASFNNLSGALPVVKTNKIYVDLVKLDGNPFLNCLPPFDPITRANCNSALPSWVASVDPMLIISGQPYTCPTLKATGDLKLQLILDPILYKHTGCICQRGYYGAAPNCLDIPSTVTTNTSNGITDNSFGSQRLMPGVDISWVLSSLELDRNALRAYIIRVTLNRANFNQFSDILEIYEGDQSLNGVRVSSTRGTDPDPIDNIPSFASNAIVVLNKRATLVFRSKKLSGLHFTANFSVSYSCPESFQYDPLSEKCQNLFVINAGIQTAIFAIISVFMILLLFITSVIIKKRNSLIIRSSSVPFCLSMLVFMIALGVGSYFYAVYPDQGNYVCNIRPWLTAGPLVGILSALLVKVDRIRRIFTSKELVVQAITNTQLAQTMGVMLGAELALLIGFSASDMSKSVFKVGSGYTNNKLVAMCTSTDSANGADAFNTWLIIQFIYIAAFLLVAVAIAWSVRKVPSAFNEAPSIASSLLSLAVLLIILIPLNYMVDDNPNALMLIRGLGQILVTSVLALFFFGPKLYLILEGKDNDKTLSSMGSSKSSNSSSASSSGPIASESNNDQYTLLMIKALKKAVENMMAGSKDTSDLSSARQNFAASYKAKSSNQIVDIIQDIEGLLNQ